MRVRLTRYGPIQPCDEVVVGYRRHGDQMTAQLEQLYAEVRRARFLLLREPWLTPRQRVLAGAAIAVRGVAAARRKLS